MVQAKFTPQVVTTSGVAGSTTTTPVTAAAINALRAGAPPEGLADPEPHRGALPRYLLNPDTANGTTWAAVTHKSGGE